MNPVAEEFLYLGFITNVVKSGGFQAALVAGISRVRASTCTKAPWVS